MPIDELIHYLPKIKLPIYTKVTDPRYNDFEIGNVYEMRIDDPERVEKKGESGPYNYIHDCILIAKEETTLGKIPALLLAFDTHSRNKKNALQRLSSEELWADDKEVVLLVFLRKDVTKEFVMSDMEMIEGNITDEFTKEDAEA